MHTDIDIGHDTDSDVHVDTDRCSFVYRVRARRNLTRAQQVWLKHFSRAPLGPSRARGGLPEESSRGTTYNVHALIGCLDGYTDIR